jgi:hypothetical protein
MYVPPFEECETVHVLLFSALLTYMKLAIGEQISTLELSYLCSNFCCESNSVM